MIRRKRKSKTMRRWGFACLFLLYCPSVMASSRHIGQYSLKQRYLRLGHIVLNLLNRTTGHTVWTKTVGNLDCVGWSPDHKALALSIVPSDDASFHLLVWQEGKSVRLLDDGPVPPGYGGGYIDGVVDIIWSPDNRRVLFRIWQSGSKSMNLGVLECLHTKRWRLSILPGDVRQMQWLGPHRVKYRVMKIVAHGNDSTLVEDARPRYWNFGK